MFESSRFTFDGLELTIHDDLSRLRQNRLRSRKPPTLNDEQLDSNNTTIKNLWEQNCQSIANIEERQWFEDYDCNSTGVELDRKHLTLIKLNDNKV